MSSGLTPTDTSPPSFHHPLEDVQTDLGRRGRLVGPVGVGGGGRSRGSRRRQTGNWGTPVIPKDHW